MKGTKDFKGRNGVTLIALIITIVILLILAGITIVTVTGENGLLDRAKEAKEITETKKSEEKIQLSVSDAKSEAILNGEDLKIDDLKKKLGEDVISGEQFPVTATIGKDSFKIDKDGNVSIIDKNSKTASELFDNTGEKIGQLHIGDFIGYTAGSWTESDMDKILKTGAKISANNLTELPKNAYQFGGFTEGFSRDINVTPYKKTEEFVNDKDTGKSVEGWRVFDVTDEGDMVLISAGCPEDFYMSGSENSAYISEYILSGHKNENATSVDFSQYEPRDWSMYENQIYRATKARAFSKSELQNWYKKYIKDSENIEFVYMRETQGESLMENSAYYWLASAYNDINLWNYGYFSGGGLYGSRGIAMGLRILVQLPSDIKLSKVGTKTVVSRTGEYNYNVWNLIN